MTWKMVIKYAFDLFIIGDTLIFDPTINWAVYNYPEGELFFAKDNIYDRAGMELYVQELNERKKNIRSSDIRFCNTVLQNTH